VRQRLCTSAAAACAAGKEYSIEQALNKMQKEWEGLELQVLEYRDSGTYIVKVEEAVSQMLDDHIVMTQAMAFSPYKRPFEDRIAKWEAQLSLVRAGGCPGGTHINRHAARAHKMIAQGNLTT
jgi:dynein heavy chain, axonemal